VRNQSNRLILQIALVVMMVAPKPGLSGNPANRSTMSICFTAGVGSADHVTLVDRGTYHTSAGFSFGALIDVSLGGGFLIGLSVEDNALSVRMRPLREFNQHYTVIALNVKRGSLGRGFAVLPGIGIGAGELNEVEDLPRCHMLVVRGSLGILWGLLCVEASTAVSLAGTDYRNGVQPSPLMMIRAGIRL